MAIDSSFGWANAASHRYSSNGCLAAGPQSDSSLSDGFGIMLGSDRRDNNLDISVSQNCALEVHYTDECVSCAIERVMNRATSILIILAKKQREMQCQQSRNLLPNPY